MAKITPNFNFAGRCEEALELYQKAFKGTNKQLKIKVPKKKLKAYKKLFGKITVKSK